MRGSEGKASLRMWLLVDVKGFEEFDFVCLFTTPSHVQSLILAPNQGLVLMGKGYHMGTRD